MKSVQNIIETKNLNYSAQKIAANEASTIEKPTDDSLDQTTLTAGQQKPAVISKEVKDAFLKKLQLMDKQSNRGKLMPSSLQKSVRPQNLTTMIGQLRPYQIKQHGHHQRPNYRIDAQTFHVSPPNCELNNHHQETSLNTSASRIQLTQRGQKSHSTTDLFDHLLTETQAQERGKRTNQGDSKRHSMLVIQQSSCH